MKLIILRYDYENAFENKIKSVKIGKYIPEVL